MRKQSIAVSLIALIVIVAGAVGYAKFVSRHSSVADFAGCVVAGYPVMESYPRQCKMADGKIFREDIGNELEKDNLIRISAPRPNDSITNPLKINGTARGNWFFEASFPVKLFDPGGKMIASGIAQAKGEWMTTEFVPFEAVLYFTAPAPGTGKLILQKDNPSGLPEKDDQLEIPVVFSASVGRDTTLALCQPTGCSGEICSDEPIVSTCVYRPEYVCYKSAKCERQASGHCGWTETSELAQCIAESKKTTPLPSKLP